MIQFHLSRTLVRDMAIHVRDDIDYMHYTTPASGAMDWYAHRVIIAGTHCVIAMEKESRYVMVFCGLTQMGYEHFPDTFQDRLWKEVLLVCNEASDEKLASLSDLVLDESVEQFYQSGHDASVTAHINQVAQSLEAIVGYDGMPLPTNTDAAIEFGVHQNEMLRKCRGDKDYFTPVEVFRTFWLGLAKKAPKNPSQLSASQLIAAQLKHESSQHEPLDRATINAVNETINLSPNVVAVDFKRRRRR